MLPTVAWPRVIVKRFQSSQTVLAGIVSQALPELAHGWNPLARGDENGTKGPLVILRICASMGHFATGYFRSHQGSGSGLQVSKVFSLAPRSLLPIPDPMWLRSAVGPHRLWN